MFGEVVTAEVVPVDRALDELAGVDPNGLDDRGLVEALTELRRSFTGAARRAVEIRDRHCQGPGCHTPAHACDIDHIHRHSDGGPTRPDNGQAHCGYRNRRREQPPPPTPAPYHETDGLARLELARKRIADRLRHDPYFG